MMKQYETWLFKTLLRKQVVKHRVEKNLAVETLDCATVLV